MARGWFADTRERPDNECQVHGRDGRTQAALRLRPLDDAATEVVRPLASRFDPWGVRKAHRRDLVEGTVTGLQFAYALEEECQSVPGGLHHHGGLGHFDPGPLLLRDDGTREVHRLGK
jgi:hypothetical protein